ncbi:MAG TPA: carbamoyltransferase [Pirellulales bacterium]|nr:carbamoyltransferase [Pirellulales bacterium]
MAVILGISAFYHDSAAALAVDGHLAAAAQEERFTRKRHDASFPDHAVQYCLREAGLTARDLDYAVFYEKPLLKFERMLETYLAFAPRGLRNFSMAIPQWLKEKLYIGRTLRQALGGEFRGKLLFVNHHESHAASAFFPSPFDEAAILTVDGAGEWSTATLGCGRGNRIELTHELRFPHSLGLLYSAFTYYCGFKVNSGEYKLMGLAPYGTPRYRDLIYDRLLKPSADGGFSLDMDYFGYCDGLTMTNGRFHRLFGGPPRAPEATLLQRHMDLAASVQAVTEETLLRMVRTLHAQTGARNLVMAGGVALNCVASGRLLREGPFESIWIQPAAGDAGGAVGAALFVWHQLLERPRQASPMDAQQGSFLGPSFSDDEIEGFLREQQIAFQRLDDEHALCERVARLIAEGKVVGWFQGRMEFGPRALGARSILADARSGKMQSTLNLKIKFRESFRPFAPCVLQEKASEWFDLPEGQESPYMLLVARVLEARRRQAPAEEQNTMLHDPDLRKRVNVVRSEIPAVTHVDYSARLQTVDRQRNPRLHGLLETFERLTGCPVLVNTSFNVRGEPIVCTPAEAFRCFMATEMDALALGRFLVEKPADRSNADVAERAQYLSEFQLD